MSFQRYLISEIGQRGRLNMAINLCGSSNQLLNSIFLPLKFGLVQIFLSLTECTRHDAGVFGPKPQDTLWLLPLLS